MLVDTGNGTYTLTVGEAELCKIIWRNGIRQCLWLVRGPQDLSTAVEAMKEFVHLTVLLGVETGLQPPVQKVAKIENGVTENGKYQERPTSPRVSENSIVQGLKRRDEGSSKSSKSGRGRARSRG